MSGKVMNAEQAVALIKSGSTLYIGGSGGGHAVPELLIKTLGEHFRRTGEPRDLTLVHGVGIGDWDKQGVSHLAQEGLLKRAITSNYGNGPLVAQFAQAEKIEAYSLPQGVLSQLCREIAAHRPGLITHVGLGTFIDPRFGGGKINRRTTEDLVEVISLGGKEWLFYKAFPIDVAFIRGTTADEAGNITMEQEAFFGEMFSIAAAARNSGGIVIAQVKRLAKRGTLPAKLVKVPAPLVDVIVVDPEQRQTYLTPYSPAYAGEIKQPITTLPKLPLDERKIIARRASFELFPGAIVNLGFGVANGISLVAAEEGTEDFITLTVEQGLFGGIPALGGDAGAGVNYEAMVDHPYQFDFYDGGGLDLAFVSFAEADAAGNVNVSRFGNRLNGPGGFINITQNAKKVVFCGTLTSGGLQVKVDNGQLHILQEGRVRKLLAQVTEITFNGEYALARGQEVLFVTERAVFRLTSDGWLLQEVAPGIDLKTQILPFMDFQPLLPSPLLSMDTRLFQEEPMGLKRVLESKV